MSRCQQTCFLKSRNFSSSDTTSQSHAITDLLSFVVWIVMEWQFCTLTAVQYWYSKSWKPRRPLFYNQVIHTIITMKGFRDPIVTTSVVVNKSDHTFYISLLNIKGDSVFTFQLRIFFFKFSIFGFFLKEPPLFSPLPSSPLASCTRQDHNQQWCGGGGNVWD